MVVHVLLSHVGFVSRRRMCPPIRIAPASGVVTVDATGWAIGRDSGSGKPGSIEATAIRPDSSSKAVDKAGIFFERFRDLISAMGQLQIGDKSCASVKPT
jgi:hypothetical protein